MTDRIEALLEAEKRGLLTPELQTSLDEARKRGLVDAPGLGERIGEAFFGTRAPTVAAGATAGALLGAPAGPLGVAAGGVLGAGAGSLGFDVARAAGGLLGKEEESVFEDPLEPSREALNEMRMEAMFGPLGQVAGPLTQPFRKPLARLLGLRSPEVRGLVQRAADQGIELGAEHVSPKKGVRGFFSKTIGVFPYIGTPLRKGQARVVGQIDDAAADILNSIAPQANRLDLSESIANAAEAQYKRFRNIDAALYNRFYQLADELPIKEIIPTEPIKEGLSDFAQRQAKSRIILESGKPLQQEVAISAEVRSFLDSLAELPEFITAEQARGIQIDLNALGRKSLASGESIARITAAGEGVKDAFHSLGENIRPDLPPEQAASVVRALDRANAFHATAKGWFETPTAQKLGRVDKKMFQAGAFKAGHINKDEIYGQVFQSGSLAAQQDLRRLIGPKEYKSAVRQFMTDSFQAAVKVAPEGSTVPHLFSAADFEKRLGLTRPEGQKVIKEMLRGTDVDEQTLMNFIEAAKAGTDVVIRDPSSFVSRRIVLGGAAALGGSVMLGAGNISMPAAVAATMLARSATKNMMSNKWLREATRLLTNDLPDQQARALFLRVFQQATRGEDGS